MSSSNVAIEFGQNPVNMLSYDAYSGGMNGLDESINRANNLLKSSQGELT